MSAEEKNSTQDVDLNDEAVASTDAEEPVVAEENSAIEDSELLDAAEDVAQESEALTELKDQVLRAQAEMQNVRKRSELEVEKARKFALERFAKELLPVADNLERALGAAVDADPEGEALKSLVEGVELTLKSLHGCFEKFSLQVIDPIGEPFDPQSHEAISMVPAPDAEPNSIIDVVQKGYRLNGRVIRAAMVVVAQA